MAALSIPLMLATLFGIPLLSLALFAR